MKLEAVIVCVDFADILAETLPLNLRHFDDLVVVTSPEDRETQRICVYHGVRHVQTDAFRSRWGEFHKAKGINIGLDNLDLDGWAVHMDADIVLPPKTRTLIARASLDKSFLYGADRFIVPGFDAWRLHQAMPALQQDNYRVNMDVFKLAPRFAGERMGGFAPPGFFQLWHPAISQIEDYPEEHTTAAKTDVLFSSRWWRNRRAFLPEFICYHLEPEACPQGANWGGRATKRWGPYPDERSPHHPRNHRPPPVHVQAGSGVERRHHPPGYGHPPHPIRPPRIQGDPRLGCRLAVRRGRWRGTEPIQFRYQWERLIKAKWVKIAGAEGPHYRPQRHDIGHHLRVLITATNDFGSAQTITRPTEPIRPAHKATP